MKANRFTYLFSLAVLLLAGGCRQESFSEPGPEPDGQELIASVTVEDDPQNVLRKALSVELKQSGAVQVEYWKSGEEKRRRTVESQSEAIEHRFKLVIMEPESSYYLRVTASAGDTVSETTSTFHTGSLPEGSSIEATNLLPEFDYSFDGYIHVGDKASGTLYLLNDKGKVVWYEPTFGKSVICSNYDKRTQSFQAIVGFNPNENFTGEIAMVVDIYGNMLMKKSYTELENPYFHHDIMMLPDGDLLIVNQVREEFDLTAVGGSANECVHGDGITCMDLDGKIRWTWSAFEVMNPEEDPDILKPNPEFQYSGKEDWLHANAICCDEEGNIYISFNKLSQFWKLDTERKLVYRMGKEGTIAIDNTDNFSDRQHALSVTPDGEVMIFDNGYTAERSRALAYIIDEKSMTARTTVCYNLPEEDFSPNQSSVYRIDDTRMIYASTVAQNVAITDCYGNLKWRYHLSAPIFRAIYIDEI